MNYFWAFVVGGCICVIGQLQRPTTNELLLGLRGGRLHLRHRPAAAAHHE